MDKTTTAKEYGALEGITRLYQEHQDLLIVALTGRTGSGCTTAAELLSAEFDRDLLNGFASSEPEIKKYNIVRNYCEKNWITFTRIAVSSVLLTFILEEEWASVKDMSQRIEPDRRLSDEALGKLEIELDKAKSRFKPLTEAINLSHAQFASYEWASASSVKDIISNTLPLTLKSIKKSIGKGYTPFLQEVGDNLRKSGSATKKEVDHTKLFRLPQRLRRLIEIIREIDKTTQTPTRIVLDAVRNPLEIVFLRDFYSPLYVVAITTDEKDRKSRLAQQNFSAVEISQIDNKEYPKKHDPLSNYKSLVTQDIQSCLQKSDLFVANPGGEKDSESSRRSSTSHMYAQLCRYIALALHPGLVTPTRDERCMQVAFIAKANSGCISRQVGAAVTDESYAVKAIGWNDVPRGQTPCSLRNVEGLQAAIDQDAYSLFERENDQLRAHVRAESVANSRLSDAGLPCSYCFKDAVNQSVFGGKSNQVHTRSLHAEENAFLQLTSGGGLGVRGGKLYTTASPCELCSKKAYQLGIRDVVYIDPYPGISISHVISSGKTGFRPDLRLFSGAVGKAYHRLYEPMLPVKDEIKARLTAG